MSTGTEIAVRARRHIGIHAEEESYPAAEASADFKSLTDMLNGWVLDGAITSFTAADAASTVTLTFADETTLTSEATEAIAATLALKLAADYEQQVTPVLATLAVRGYDMILRKQHLASDVAQSSYDSAISYMPSQRFVQTPQG